MKTDQLGHLRTLISAKLPDLARLPGILSVEPGYRIRADKPTGEPAAIVTVDRKIGPEALNPGEELREVFGSADVDVVEASPLRLLFARPDRFAVSPEFLAYLEETFGYPFAPDAIVVQPSRQLLARRPPASARISYQRPSGVKLEPVAGHIKLLCHAGPDAGWQVLHPFLQGVRRNLIAGMFDLTAPHIGDALVALLERQADTFKLVLDKKDRPGTGVKRDDRPERTHINMFQSAGSKRFIFAYAYTSRDGGTFATDYHIKLAVRDRGSFWLSSGSWQSSNQPDLDPLGSDAGNSKIQLFNREWHIVGEHQALADVWARFLEWDLETAQQSERLASFRLDHRPPMPDVFAEEAIRGFAYRRFFPPQEFSFDAGTEGSVLPLLTPDNYIGAVSDLVRAAKVQLLVQNQSLGFLKEESSQDPRYTELTNLLARRSHDLGEGFRMLIRDPAEFGGDAEESLRVYRSKGLSVDRIRFQVGCHNKGMIADGETLLLGSHNLTDAGTTANRDASLLIKHRGIATYYSAIFDHDWSIADPHPPRRRVRLALPGEATPQGFRRFGFWEFFGFD